MTLVLAREKEQPFRNKEIIIVIMYSFNKPPYLFIVMAQSCMGSPSIRVSASGSEHTGAGVSFWLSFHTETQLSFHRSPQDDVSLDTLAPVALKPLVSVWSFSCNPTHEMTRDPCSFACKVAWVTSIEMKVWAGMLKSQQFKSVRLSPRVESLVRKDCQKRLTSKLTRRFNQWCRCFSLQQSNMYAKQ